MYDPALFFDRQRLAQHILRVVLDADFSEEAVADRGIRERVFHRLVDNVPGVRVMVYTTIEGYWASAIVRERGEDAIRVCAVYRDAENNDHGIASTTRIHRTGTIKAICARLLERMRDTYREALRVPRCPRCDAPMFLSKKKNRVCAALCWTRRGGVQGTGSPRIPPAP